MYFCCIFIDVVPLVVCILKRTLRFLFHFLQQVFQPSNIGTDTTFCRFTSASSFFSLCSHRPANKRLSPMNIQLLWLHCRRKPFGIQIAFGLRHPSHLRLSTNVRQPLQWQCAGRWQIHEWLIVKIASQTYSSHIVSQSFKWTHHYRTHPSSFAFATVFNYMQLIIERSAISSQLQWFFFWNRAGAVRLQHCDMITMMSANTCTCFVIFPTGWSTNMQHGPGLHLPCLRSHLSSDHIFPQTARCPPSSCPHHTHQHSAPSPEAPASARPANRQLRPTAVMPEPPR